MNKWESDEDKLKWLRVRLVGKARTAYRRLGQSARSDYGECKDALLHRFHPDSARDLYMAELQARKRRKDEDWASFGDALRVLADKAYPELEEKARERLALNQFLSQIDNPCLSFSVRQTRPQTVDKAAAVTIEMETYLGHSSKTIGLVPAQQNSEPSHKPEPEHVIAAAVKTEKDRGDVAQLIERLDRLEKLVQDMRPTRSRGGVESKDRQHVIVCWNCGGKGHIARNCTTHSKSQQQENDHPSVLRVQHERDSD